MGPCQVFCDAIHAMHVRPTRNYFNCGTRSIFFANLGEKRWRAWARKELWNRQEDIHRVLALEI